MQSSKVEFAFPLPCPALSRLGALTRKPYRVTQENGTEYLGTSESLADFDRAPGRRRIGRSSFRPCRSSKPPAPKRSTPRGSFLPRGAFVTSAHRGPGSAISRAAAPQSLNDASSASV